MKTRDLVDLAARNLREAIFRNSLTTLGIGVGVASLVAMLSLGVGLQNLASDSLSHSGLFNAIIVTPRTNFTGFGRPERANPAEAAAAATPIEPLDDSARGEIRALPNVIEVYPEIRFPTEIHYNGNPYPTIVAGIPESDRDGGSFDGMQGHFFSGPDASEAILQIDLAKQLSDQPYSLLGKDLVLRYAERTPLAAGSGANSEAGGFSIVPHEEKLRVVGIVTTEPSAGLGTFGRGRLLIPLQLAEQLQATQTNDLRDLIRDTTASAKKTYDNLTVRVKDAVDVKAAEDAIKKMGFSAFSLLDATRNLRLVFTVFDLLLLIFGSLALVVASLGIINTLVMAILERAPRNRRAESAGGGRPRRAKAFLCGGGGYGPARRHGWRGDRLAHRAGAQFRHRRLFDAATIASDHDSRRAMVDGGGGNRIFGCGEPRGGDLSGVARGEAESGRGVAV